MDETSVRRVIQEEIVKAFRIMEGQVDYVPYGTGDFERAFLGVLARVLNDAADEITESENGHYPKCSLCDSRPNKEPHDEPHKDWCPHGA